MLTEIISIRHGDYNEDDKRISYLGKRQMHNLVKEIQGYLNNGKIIVFLSSSAPWVEDSAKILSSKLGISYEVSEKLWCDKNHPEDEQKALAYIKERAQMAKASVVMFVTHSEYAQILPRMLVNDAGKNFHIPLGTMNKGDMLYVNLQKDSYSHIRA